MEDEALASDSYLEMLLGAGSRAHLGGPHPAALGRAWPAPAEDAWLAPDLEHAAQVLRQSLVRLHPSFRFEEALAGRLARAWTASGDRPARSSVTPLFPVPAPSPDADWPVERRARGLLLGGAIASGVSLAGAAYYVWRRGRARLA